MTDPLDSYPQLRRLWPRELIESLGRTDHRYNWAIAGNSEADKIRQQLEAALKWASENGFLSADHEGRLRGSDRVQFHSAKDELLIGNFLTRVGQVKPANVLPNGRVGDWVINGESPVYLEVKSIYDIDDEANRIQVQLREAAKTVQSGRILEVSISEAGTLSVKEFRAYLEASLSTLPEGLNKEVKLSDYIDPSGLTVSLTCLPYQSDGPTELVISFGGGGPITSHLQMQARARKGASQLPEPAAGIPGMVLVCRHSDAPDTGLELLGAMFSLPAVNVQTGKWTVQPAGITQPDRHTRVSAVGQYFDRPERLEIIHNPFAKNPINPEKLLAPEIRQLVPDGPGRLQWIGE